MGPMHPIGPVTLDDVRAACARIAGAALRTPLIPLEVPDAPCAYLHVVHGTVRLGPHALGPGDSVRNTSTLCRIFPEAASMHTARSDFPPSVAVVSHTRPPWITGDD